MEQSITSQRRRRGFVLPLAVLLFTALIGIVAFAVDWGYISSTKSALRNAVDAANLAGASGLTVSPAEARKRAKEIAASNMVNGQPVVLQDSDIELGTWDSTNRTFQPLATLDETRATAVRITAQMTKQRGNPVKLIFAPLIGYGSTDVVVSAVAGFGQAADVVIVQDITASFDKEIADAKIGDQALIDALYASGAGGSSVGFVVHTGWGKTLSPLRTISSEYSTLSHIISSVKLCGNSGMPVCSGTDIASGLEEAIKVFNDPDYLSFAGATRAIVLVSDGEPSASSSGSHPTLSNSQLLDLAVEKADEAWAQGIHVYVVFFNRENSATAAGKVSQIPRGMGNFVQVTDASKLPDAMEAVTKRLPKGLLK
jgi:Flp pilus assembly protein TadG